MASIGTARRPDRDFGSIAPSSWSQPRSTWIRLASKSRSQQRSACSSPLPTRLHHPRAERAPERSHATQDLGQRRLGDRALPPGSRDQRPRARPRTRARPGARLEPRAGPPAPTAAPGRAAKDAGKEHRSGGGALDGDRPLAPTDRRLWHRSGGRQPPFRGRALRALDCPRRDACLAGRSAAAPGALIAAAPASACR